MVWASRWRFFYLHIENARLISNGSFAQVERLVTWPNLWRVVRFHAHRIDSVMLPSQLWTWPIDREKRRTLVPYDAYSNSVPDQCYLCLGGQHTLVVYRRKRHPMRLLLSELTFNPFYLENDWAWSSDYELYILCNVTEQKKPIGFRPVHPWHSTEPCKLKDH